MKKVLIEMLLVFKIIWLMSCCLFGFSVKIKMRHGSIVYERTVASCKSDYDGGDDQDRYSNNNNDA